MADTIVLLTEAELLLLRQRLSDGPGTPAVNSVLDAKLYAAQREVRLPAHVIAAAEAIGASLTFRLNFPAACPLDALHPAAAEFARLAVQASLAVSGDGLALDGAAAGPGMNTPEA